MKILKIIGSILAVLLVTILVVFYHFSNPKSDAYLLRKFAKADVVPFIEHRVFRSFTYRIITLQERIDPDKLTLVFVHGSIGSGMDFKTYLADPELRAKFNLITYDRIGYGPHHTGQVQESIAFEAAHLEYVVSGIDPASIIVAGYSFGGPVALASKKQYKGIVLLAAAVSSEAEYMPGMLNFYKWKLTRWLVPDTWKSASKEKMSHASDLRKYERAWHTHPSRILIIHGDADWIVPYANAEFLQEQFPPSQIRVKTLSGAGHGLIWSRSEEIKREILDAVEWFNGSSGAGD